MSVQISPQACVAPEAELEDDVEIGPFCFVGPHVRIQSGTRLLSSVTVMGHVSIGADNVIYPQVVLGGEPQDISYTGSDTQVIIGDGNIIREGVTINRGSEKEDGITRIGDRNFLMACSHGRNQRRKRQQQQDFQHLVQRHRQARQVEHLQRMSLVGG